MDSPTVISLAYLLKWFYSIRHDVWAEFVPVSNTETPTNLNKNTLFFRQNQYPIFD